MAREVALLAYTSYLPKHKEQAVSKKSSHNWKKVLLLPAVRVISAFVRLTRPERVKCHTYDFVLRPHASSECFSFPAEMPVWDLNNRRK